MSVIQVEKNECTSWIKDPEQWMCSGLTIDEIALMFAREHIRIACRDFKASQVAGVFV